MVPRAGHTKITGLPLAPLSPAPNYHGFGSRHTCFRYPHAARGPVAAPAAPPADAAPAPPLPRRALLSAGLAAPLLSLLHASAALPPADAASSTSRGPPSPPPPRRRVKSAASARPALLAFINSLDRPIKVYWVNYDADEELYAFLPPGVTWEVDTFETHPWRVRDAASNAVILELVASAREERIEVTEELAAAAAGAAGAGSADDSGGAAVFEGFDGVGGVEEAYGAAEISEIALDHLGGVALLAVAGFPAPVPLPVAGIEAAQLFHAAGVEFRRPTTIHAWARSLAAAGVAVERCLVTRLVGTTYYARVVMRMPGGGGLRSVDARPSDAVALALAAGAPLFVARRIARAAQPGSVEGMALRREAEPPAGRMPAAVEGGRGEGEGPAATPGGRGEAEGPVATPGGRGEAEGPAATPGGRGEAEGPAAAAPPPPPVPSRANQA